MIESPALAKLRASATISRDFQDLKAWPRDKRYNPNEYGYPPNKKRGVHTSMRPWAKCTAIMLHTMDAPNMYPNRLLGLPVHGGIANDATVVLCHPPNRRVSHGHNGNGYAIGVEIAGVKGAITKEQIEPARALVRYYYELRQEHHEGAMYITAHRQTHWSRTNDPGALIWREVALPMMRELGLLLGPVVGSGVEIDDDWFLELELDDD